MEKSNLKLTKIPIEYLLEILETLYNEGYDYFDLEGIIDPDKEVFVFSQCKCYTKIENSIN